MTLQAVEFWDDELAALDVKATAIFGEDAVLDAIQRLSPPREMQAYERAIGRLPQNCRI